MEVESEFKTFDTPPRSTSTTVNDTTTDDPESICVTQEFDLTVNPFRFDSTAKTLTRLVAFWCEEIVDSAQTPRSVAQSGVCSTFFVLFTVFIFYTSPVG